MRSSSTAVRSLPVVRIIVAGFGNVLRADDGVGVGVVQHLARHDAPDGVELIEIGSGGIHLVQCLLDGADALVVVDAMSAGRTPGTVMVVRPEITDPSTLGVHDLRDQVADMHLASPDRALAVARGLGVLPAVVWMVGIEPVDDQAWGESLSEPVASAVVVAADQVRELVSGAGIRWASPAGS